MPVLAPFTMREARNGKFGKIYAEAVSNPDRRLTCGVVGGNGNSRLLKAPRPAETAYLFSTQSSGGSVATHSASR
jgi:hypothetical protein